VLALELEVLLDGVVEKAHLCCLQAVRLGGFPASVSLRENLFKVTLPGV
jgi:hypothetical protein